MFKIDVPHTIFGNGCVSEVGPEAEKVAGIAGLMGENVEGLPYFSSATGSQSPLTLLNSSAYSRSNWLLVSLFR